MKTKGTTMKTLTLVLLAALGLSGCVAVPVYDGYGPRAYGPAVVVRPYSHYGYRSHYNSRDHW
jgi:hypothetical protein